MFFLSKLLGSPVRDAADKAAGTLGDLIVSSGQAYPRVTALAVKRRGKIVYAAWEQVTSFEESGTILRVPATAMGDRELEAGELPLSATFLDKQLVDTEGRKVIRVNDIQLLRTGIDVHVVAVDVSSGAILRRVGLARVGERIAKGRQNPKPHLIVWKDVDVEHTDDSSVRLAVPRTKLELLHPADIADLVHELSPEERAAVLDALEDDLAADTFEELLSYPEHSAGGIMTTDYAWARLDDTAEKATQRLREQAEYVETVYYIYVVDRSEKLRGVFSLRDLLTTPLDKKVRDFMTENPVSVSTLASEEEITDVIAKYNLLALPVVDDEGELHGIITIDDAIDLVLPLAWKKRLPRIFH